VTQSTILSSGTINGADTLTIEAIQPDSMPAVVRIVWPTAATITTPAHYREVASAAMRLLAEASTTLARIRASRRLKPTWSTRLQAPRQPAGTILPMTGHSEGKRGPSLWLTPPPKSSSQQSGSALEPFHVIDVVGVPCPHMRYAPPPKLHPFNEASVRMCLVVRQQAAQGIGGQHAVILDQEHVVTGLDQLPDFVVDRRNPAPALLILKSRRGPGISPSTSTLSELRLFDQVGGPLIQDLIAVDVGQQPCPLGHTPTALVKRKHVADAVRG
jgi:hypothetical protein